MVQNEIAKGVKLEKCTIEDVVVCKLEKNCFGLDNDIFIVNSYIKPANTSSKNSDISGFDTIRELDQFLNVLLSKGDVITCGDFNSRIGHDIDFIKGDKCGYESFIPLPEDYIPQELTIRNSQDKKSNNYKRPFLEMLVNNELHILNGRTLGDSYGDFTCIQTSGASVVDYFVISPNCSKYVCHMTIQPFTCFSDHKPLLLALNFSPSNTLVNTKALHETYARAPLRYKITPDSLTSLRDTMMDPLVEECSKTLLETDYPDDPLGTYTLNEDITLHLNKIADKCLQKTKHPKITKKGSINKQPWFTEATREAKISCTRAAKIVSDFPNSDYLRKKFYQVKNTYKRLIDRSKNKFLDKLNTDIESGKILNWKQFKKLKKFKGRVDKFDCHDMENFQKFFGELYANAHSTITAEKKKDMLQNAEAINNNCRPSPAQSILNGQISVQEISTALSSLKNGKSSSEDMICNEILKTLSTTNIQLLCKVFNSCLDTGTYPWNNSIVTPLHKKGDRENPDNYRAIAVSSTIGKLFSTIMLNRIIEFKNKYKPDPINQLGFAKGAQTYDHILTLNTITSKYKKLKVPVYAVFVDFRKAFDSVCREALFLKLAKLGITGKTFNVLKHMYKNSTGQMKLSGFISEKFDINKGTEQGHPLSPDLFKIYIRDLSPQLEHDNCPKLMNQLISHLLWADDLILLALDPKTLQKQLDTLNNFCLEWGVEINANKTKLMKFNARFENCQPVPLKIGNHFLEEVDSYCYLGIEVHKSGSFTNARTELKKKAMRALYAMKSSINKSKLSFRSLTTLFDGLIKPIVLYGAPIYTPNMSIIKHITKQVDHSSDPETKIKFQTSTLKKISLLNSEKVHLHFLKWSLGVHRKTSNAGVWGESGRYPLIYECINLTLKYAQRLKNLKDNSLVSLAFKEQMNMKLDWYRGLEPVLALDPCFSTDHVTAYRTLKNNHSKLIPERNPSITKLPKEDFLIHNGFKKQIPSQSTQPIGSKIFTPHIITKRLKCSFREYWESCINTSQKLEFYSDLKSKFNKECYLDSVIKYADRTNITRLRISAHRLEIELGRYNQTPRDDRICSWCNIVLGSSTIENEDHFLNHCDLNAASRRKVLDKIQSIISNQNTPSATSHPFQTVIPGTNVLKLISNNSEIIESITNESQVHLTRVVARFATTCINNRKKFVDSLANT